MCNDTVYVGRKFGEMPVPDGMALIPAGSFSMGDSLTERESHALPVHTVDISAFYMDKYEVTKAKWEKAARGGLSGQRFPWGATIQHALANYYSLSYFSYDTSSTRNSHPSWDKGYFPFTSLVGVFAPPGRTMLVSRFALFGRSTSDPLPVAVTWPTEFVQRPTTTRR